MVKTKSKLTYKNSTATTATCRRRRAYATYLRFISLFGNYFKTQDGHVIDGIGILDIETIAGSERMIGNIITDSSEFGRIVGFENHSGLTYLRKGVEPFAKVIRGGGNNNQDKSEGARYRNVIGTYPRPATPQNPQIADWMLQIAITKKFGSFTPSQSTIL